MTKREFLARLIKARAAAKKNMLQHDGTKYSRGLSSEGYMGGYIQALDDVDAVLRHGYPNDPRHVWEQEP